MQGKQFSRDDLILDHDKAAEFMHFMQTNSFGFVPHDWAESDTPSMQNMAVMLFNQIEREINTCEYLKISGIIPH